MFLSSSDQESRFTPYLSQPNSNRLKDGFGWCLADRSKRMPETDSVRFGSVRFGLKHSACNRLLPMLSGAGRRESDVPRCKTLDLFECHRNPEWILSAKRLHRTECQINYFCNSHSSPIAESTGARRSHPIRSSNHPNDFCGQLLYNQRPEELNEWHLGYLHSILAYRLGDTLRRQQLLLRRWLLHEHVLRLSLFVGSHDSARTSTSTSCALSPFGFGYGLAPRLL
mmetsp:Transcript_15574/g.35909  ORF Transcript_15574/g.35909 Transcript_15574/m.35909 type:complete len:226 (-) Transcript_15574:108-785(-)